MGLIKSFNSLVAWVTLAVFCAVLVIDSFASASPELTGTTGHPAAPSTTISPDNCEAHSQSCDACVKSSAKCYYCWKTKKCGVYHPPMPSDCGDSLNDFSYRTCSVRANVLVIVLGSLLGLVVLIILLLLGWCCLIRPCVRRCHERQEEKWERNRVRLSELQSQRRKERQQQRDAIRAKYGLGGPAYDKF